MLLNFEIGSLYGWEVCLHGLKILEHKISEPQWTQSLEIFMVLIFLLNLYIFSNF